MKRIILVIILCLALALAGCGGGSVKIPGQPQIPPAEVGVESTITNSLFWYDPLTDRDQWRCWSKVRQTSNALFAYLPDLPDLLARYSLEGWPRMILGGSGEEIDRTADAAAAIIRAGYPHDLYIFAWDEPDLGAKVINGKTYVQVLTHQYNALAGALAARGIRARCKIGPVWSVASAPPWDWRSQFEAFGLPPMDFIAIDGWYTGAANELHLVRERNLQFIDYIQERLGELPKIHILKVFSRVPPDLEEISPEWVLRQLKLVTGTGTSTYEWTNPNYGDTSTIVLEPIPPKYRGETLGFFVMSDDPRGDVRFAGCNRPDVLDAIRSWAKPRGLTME